MRRFFCKLCNKVKRVRKFPTFISNESAEKPTDRIGSCDWHSVRGGTSHSALLNHKRKPHVNVKKKAAAPQPKPKKQGRNQPEEAFA